MRKISLLINRIYYQVKVSCPGKTLFHLSWKVFIHSVDDAHSAYHIILFIEFPSCKKLNLLKLSKIHWEPLAIFATNDKSFLRNGSMKLAKRWQEIIEQNGKYIA